jgi:hypothetical protein
MNGQLEVFFAISIGGRRADFDGYAYKLMLMWIADSLRNEALKWKALGDPARWRIFCTLAREPRSVTELCEELDTYQSQVSGHLAVLRRAGLVSVVRSGYFYIYRVNSSSSWSIG